MISYRNKKYLVCYLQAGLGDMLNEIETCYDYCIEYNRILVLDSRYNWFKDDIRKYIQFNHGIIYKGELDTLYNILNTKSTYPNELSGCLKSIQFSVYPDYLSIDHNKLKLYTNRSEFVQIYSMCRVNSTQFKILDNCSFTPLVLNVFRERYNKLPKDYLAVHIRNTDKKSNVDDFLDKYANELQGMPIFLATDHAPSIQKFKDLFGSNLYSFANIPDNNSKPIHYDHSNIHTQEFNIDCIVDLLLLAGGSKLYCLNVIGNYPSGYGRLAKTLHENKSLFAKLIGEISPHMVNP
jgi:hypothetical protein